MFQFEPTNETEREYLAAERHAATCIDPSHCEQCNPPTHRTHDGDEFTQANVVRLLRQLASTAFELTEAWEDDGNIQLDSANPFNGGRDFDLAEWALQVDNLAEDYDANKFNMRMSYSEVRCPRCGEVFGGSVKFFAHRETCEVSK